MVLSSLEEWSAAEVTHRDGLLGFGYFGSYARGNEGFGSDLDLIAIVEADDRPAMERARDWPTENLPVPADLLVYTADEWEQLQAEGDRFVRTLNAEARWLVSRETLQPPSCANPDAPASSDANALPSEARRLSPPGHRRSGR